MGPTKIVNGAEITEIELDPSKTNDQLEREAKGPKRPAPSDAHKYTVSKIKSHNGHEGLTLNAVLLRDGKKAAELLDDGNGGMMYFYWVDGHHDTPEQEKFLAFIESERAKIPADKESHEGFNDRKLFDGDIWVWEEVNRIQRIKACKKYTIFQVGSEIGTDTWKQVKGVEPEARAWVEKKYAGQKIRFMNDEVKG